MFFLFHESFFLISVFLYTEIYTVCLFLFFSPNISLVEGIFFQPVVLGLITANTLFWTVYIVQIMQNLQLLVCQGRTLHSELHGEIKMKCFLVGTPVIAMTLNQDVDVCQQQAGQTGQQLFVACCRHTILSTKTGTYYLPPRPIWSSTLSLLHALLNAKVIDRQAFMFAASTVWNFIPQNIRLSQFLGSMKCSLKTLFFSLPG